VSLENWYRCTACPLSRFRRRVVLGKGTIPAQILIVGEAPGKSEDLRGEPFVGPAGRILHSAIEDATELSEHTLTPTIYITNTVACRPTDTPRGPNREPTKKEILTCMPRFQATVRMVAPQEVILLGKVAEVAYKRLYPDAVCLRHPAYILRKGGTESTEYRGLVRGLVDVFNKIPVEHHSHGRTIHRRRKNEQS